jgi:uncharacterized integral membrane protein (TIGR00698 family)
MRLHKGKPLLSEDWTATLFGFMLIGSLLPQWVVLVPTYAWKAGSDLFSNVLSLSNLTLIGLQGCFILFGVVVNAQVRGISLAASVKLFFLVFIISQLALIVAGNTLLKSLNLEAVIVSLFFGLLLGNLFSLPSGWSEVLSTELYVKIGLVLLGSSIIFSDLLKAGVLGLIQSLVVVVSVWYVAFWISRLLKVEEELALMLSSAVSICGVSAAIATAGAIKGDPKKLSFVISLVLVTAIPMMVAMPYVANYFHFSPEVTGAWLGGTIDTTGAVVAAGTLAGEAALKVSTIVKFSQNVLLGLAAFAISIYWAYVSKAKNQEPITGTVIWQRFPKFVIGFVVVSFVFSFFVSATTVAQIKDSVKSFQTLWFVLAFTSIGFETKFADFFRAENKRPLYAFLLAQGVNVFITLAVAWFLFG